MPLKPIFEKAPFKSLSTVSLRPGQVRMQNTSLKKLYALAADCADTAVLEGMFRAAAVLGEDMTAIENRLNVLLEKCAENGTDITESVQIMRTAMAAYEYQPRREMLEKIVSWCKYVWEHADEVLDCDAIRHNAADLVELLCFVYRVTGLKSVLELIGKVREKCKHYDAILRTFDQSRPMKSRMTAEELQQGLNEENGSEEGYYTREYLSNHAETLFDGARLSLLDGMISGNGQALVSPKTGLERMSRFHGAVCGGMTADETVAGLSPAAGVDAAAFGAELEMLAHAGEAAEQAVWAWEETEKLLANAVPHSLLGDKVMGLQHVNALTADADEEGAYLLSGNRDVRVLARMLRGVAQAVSGTVREGRDGVTVTRYESGSFMTTAGDKPMVLHMAAAGDDVTMTVDAKEDAAFALKLRIPAWTDGAAVTIDGETRRVAEGQSMVAIRRVWKKGDTLTLHLKRKLTVTEGYHSGVSVSYGAQVMTMPAAEKAPWAFACMGMPEMKDGAVMLPVCPVEWRKKGAQPGELPVMPKADGEVQMVALVPYAESCGITLFPRGRKA